MKASSEKSSSTPSKTATQTANQPFFHKAGGGDFFAPSVQMKMTVNKPGDKFEREADTMAAKVMRMPSPASGQGEKLQRQPEDKLQKKEEDKIQKAAMPEEKLQKAAMPEEKLQKKEEEKLQKAALPEDKIQKAAMPEEKLQKKDDEKLQKAPAEENKLQRKGSDAGASAVTSNVQSAIHNTASAGGQPLSADVRSYMEPRFNADFSNVRVHSDPESAGLSNQLSARAFTYQNHVFFSQDQYQPGTSEGKQLLAHELTHTIQQGHAVQRSPQVSTTVTPPHVQREGLFDSFDFLFDKAIDYIAGHADAIPGFTMLTVVIGYNPITRASVDRSAGNILRGALNMIPVVGNQITQALNNHGVFDKVSVFVEQQFNALKDIGSNIWQDIKQFVKKFSLLDLRNPGKVWEQAKGIVTAPIGQIKAFAVGLKDGIIVLIKDAILKPIAAFAKANAPNGYDLLCAVLGKDPISGEEVPPTPENLIGPFMKLIGQGDVWQKMQETKAIPRAWAWFKNAVGAVKGFVQQIPALFIAAFESLEIVDIVLLSTAFNKLKAVFGGFIDNFINWAGNAVWNLLEIIFDVVKPGAMAYVKRTGAALKSILKNPIPFVGNLINAAKLGFQSFASNIGAHLKAGLIDWLTGSLAGVYIPKALSLSELGKLALSVFGITWAGIRKKLVKALGDKGEKIVSGIEKGVEWAIKGFEIVKKLATGGIAAAWEMIQEKLTDLKDTLVSGITGFVTDTIVKKAIPKLIGMFIPGAGFIPAIISIYDTVMVFVQKISKIIQVVTAFIDSIVTIAAGNISGAARRVESILSGLLSLAISFLAGFLGLGKVTDKIKGVIDKVRDKVDKAIDAALAWVVTKAKALFAKLFGKKDKKDQKDDRTLEEKLQALHQGIAEGFRIAKRPGATRESVDRELPRITKKFRLRVLNTVDIGTDQYRIHGEVNPDENSEALPKTLTIQQALSTIRQKLKTSTEKFEISVSTLEDAKTVISSAFPKATQVPSPTPGSAYESQADAKNKADFDEFRQESLAYHIDIAPYKVGEIRAFLAKEVSEVKASLERSRTEMQYHTDHPVWSERHKENKLAIGKNINKFKERLKNLSSIQSNLVRHEPEWRRLEQEGVLYGHSTVEKSPHRTNPHINIAGPLQVETQTTKLELYIKVAIYVQKKS
jgi:hypothetical protein